MDFYKSLNYSLGNEDWSVEKQALRVAPSDRVVCVTASGDRSLHLLMTECAEIISIDMNRIQNFLLDLKVAAISQLDYEKYLAFMGCYATRHRQTIFKQIKSSLSAESAAFWANHAKIISRGIIYQGRTERLANVGAKFIQLLRYNNVKQLFLFDDLDEQRRHVLKKWDTKVWQKFFEVILNPKLFKFILNDPGINSFADAVDQPGTYIYKRILRYLNNHLAKKSALLQLVMMGKVLPEAYFPYLTWEGYNLIRRDLSRLHYKTGNIVEFLNKQSANSIDAFSLSDIASYMPQASFEKLLNGIYHAAKPGARFCIREFMSSRFIPQHLTPHFQRNNPLELKLEIEESNFVYRFMVGEIQKS